MKCGVDFSRFREIAMFFLKRDAERERRHRRDEVGEIIKNKKENHKKKKE